MGIPPAKSVKWGSYEKEVRKEEYVVLLLKEWRFAFADETICWDYRDKKEIYHILHKYIIWGIQNTN